MTEYDALYRAICENPDEDAPRLVLADWLDEEGSRENRARADLIRTHIHLSREEPWSPTWRVLNESWEKLRKKTMKQAKEGKLSWLKHLKGRGFLAWKLERGLVGHITVYSKRFVAEGNKYFERDPIISVKFAHLNSMQGTVSPYVLFTCPFLASAAKLHLESGFLRDSELNVLGESPLLPRLQSLAIRGTNLYTFSEAASLLRRLPALTELSLAHNGEFTDDYARAFAACPELSRLKSLDLDFTGITARGIAAISASPYAAGLNTLYLSSAAPYAEYPPYSSQSSRARTEGTAVAQAIASSPSFRCLRELRLNGWFIDDDGIRTILSSQSLPSLRCLELQFADVTSAGLARAADSTVGRQLWHLKIGSASLQNERVFISGMFPNAYVERM